MIFFSLITAGFRGAHLDGSRNSSWASFGRDIHLSGLGSVTIMYSLSCNTACKQCIIYFIIQHNLKARPGPCAELVSVLILESCHTLYYEYLTDLGCPTNCLLIAPGLCPGACDMRGMNPSGFSSRGTAPDRSGFFSRPRGSCHTLFNFCQGTRRDDQGSENACSKEHATQFSCHDGQDTRQNNRYHMINRVFFSNMISSTHIHYRKKCI